MSKRIHVVINPAAGQPEPILHILNNVFRPADVQWDISITHELGDATRQARQAAEDGADIVVAYGGDGTVMEVANGLVGTEVALGVVPGGTGNVLSIELEIPQASEEAAQLLVSPHKVRKVDVGRSGDRSFLLRAYVGFDAQRIQLTTREMRDRYGKMAYLIAALKAIPESEAIRFNLTLDDEEVECEGFTCIVQNAGNMGLRGLTLAPGVSIDDGLLDVIVIHGLDPLSLASALGSIVDTPLDPDRFHHWQARDLTIATDSPHAVIGDGESWGETPVTMKALPGAVRVIAPSRT
ncbi:MAG: diacylglycerol kinase family lipid kinase [Anaerolineae bacterium]|jgi:diacylglycerol kinase (ATP)